LQVREPPEFYWCFQPQEVAHPAFSQNCLRLRAAD
jgi:hypothetical protein